jgi:Domain of unknown function (DUF4136)
MSFSTQQFRPACLPKVLALFVALGLSACASTSSAVRVDKSEEVHLSKCRSFEWLPASTEAAASFTEQRVRAEVMAQLRAKGYEQVAEKPDCRITYFLSTQEQPRPGPTVGVGAAGGSGGIGGGLGVSIPVGRKRGASATFTIDVIDVERNEQIWSGSVDTTLAASEPSAEEAQAAVREILAEFPERNAPRQ